MVNSKALQTFFNNEKGAFSAIPNSLIESNPKNLIFGFSFDAGLYLLPEPFK
jgi:hypothetical protein